MTKYEAEFKTVISYEFNYDINHIADMWNDIKKLAGDDLYVVLLRHQNLGIGAFPPDAQAALLKLPKTDLDSLCEHLSEAFHKSA